MGNIIVVAIVILLMALAIRYLLRHRGSCAGCSGDCGCSHCSVAEKMVKDLEKAAGGK